MIKTYCKTDTIRAEQFDGSDEMVEKYHIEYDETYILPFRIETPNGWLGMKIGDWIVIRVNGEYWPITNNELSKTYSELPVISKEVADWIELGKRTGISLDTALMITMAGRKESSDISGVSRWIWHYHMADIAIAWAIGYTVEEEQK